MNLKSNDIDLLWNKVALILKDKIRHEDYICWIKPISIFRFTNKEIILGAPTIFIKEHIEDNLLDKIEEVLLSIEKGITSIRVIVVNKSLRKVRSIKVNKVDTSILSSNSSIKESSKEKKVNNKSKNEKHITGNQKVNLNSKFTFDNFIVDKSNELAWSAAKRISELDKVEDSLNPLFIYGGVGLGKTHLMQATASKIMQNFEYKKIIYISAESFMLNFIRALRSKTTLDFKEVYRSVDVLIIDDLQFILNKGQTQEEFFHTFNSLMQQGKQIILSADRSPTELGGEGLAQRIKSRLSTGFMANVYETTYELRLGVLQSLAIKYSKEGINIPHNVLEFIAHKIKSNVRELEGALNQVVASARLVNKSIDVDLAYNMLSDLIKGEEVYISIESIQKHVATHFKIKVADLLSNSRLRRFVRPRQISMYICRNLTSKSLPDIGRSFGGRDHSTVNHAIKKVKELMSKDAEFRVTVDSLMNILSK